MKYKSRSDSLIYSLQWLLNRPCLFFHDLNSTTLYLLFPNPTQLPSTIFAAQQCPQSAFFKPVINYSTNQFAYNLQIYNVLLCMLMTVCLCM